MIRNLVPGLLALALLSACDSNDDPEVCPAAPLATRVDTVAHFSVDGQGVVFGSSDQVLLQLDTLDHRLTLLAIRNEGSYYTERAIRAGVGEFSGPGVYPIGGAGDPDPIAYARYWCPIASGGSRMYTAAGRPGDVVHIISFDSVTGLVEGRFQFHTEEWREDREGPIVTNGYFLGSVVRVGDEVGADVDGIGH